MIRKSHAFADIQADHPELLAARRVGDGNLVDGGAPMLHHGFAQPLGIAFTGSRKLDDLLRDHFIRNVTAINKPKRN